jgi:zinc transport system ATP-binding protein
MTMVDTGGGRLDPIGGVNLLPSTKPAAVEVRDLTAGYDGTIALEDVSMTVEEGDFFAITGPNGGGKTTLLKAMMGLIKPIRGSIRVMGEPPSEGWKHIGYVPQFAEYDRAYPISVEEVVLMGRRSRRGMHPFYSPDDRRAAEKAMKALELLELRERKISDLSGGQRQWVYLARAIVSRPKILLLDEPTASVDKKMQRNFYDLLVELNKEVTIIMVTHDIGVVSSYVKKVACLNRFVFAHEESALTREMLEKSYRRPVDLLTCGRSAERKG